MRVYEVGGSVRDSLIGMTPHDRDWLVVNADEQTMIEKKFRRLHADFPVFAHPVTSEEYALARIESKTGMGYRGFVFETGKHISLEQDLQRRDLTINAIARAANGTLVDPFSGIQDVQLRRLRHIDEAFREDPLRILRVARLQARLAHLGFSIAPETLAIMEQMCATKELSTLSPQRVWSETLRALDERSPHAYFRTLHDVGGLRHWFPEIEALFGIPQSAEVDVGTHSLMVLEQVATLCADTITRYAALTHDLGKALTPPSQLPSHRGHERRGVACVKQLSERLRVGKKFDHHAALVARLHGMVAAVERLSPASCLRVIEAADALRRPEQVECLLICFRANFLGRKMYNGYVCSRVQKWQKIVTALKKLRISLPNGADNRQQITRSLRIGAIVEELRPITRPSDRIHP